MPTVDREMDARIAEIVGWTWHDGSEVGPGFAGHRVLFGPPTATYQPAYWPDSPFRQDLPFYSTSDDDALAALDVWRERDPKRGYEISFDPRNPDRVRASLLHWTPSRGINCYEATVRYGPTRAAAICNAIIALDEQEKRL